MGPGQVRAWRQVGPRLSLCVRVRGHAHRERRRDGQVGGIRGRSSHACGHLCPPKHSRTRAAGDKGSSVHELSKPEPASLRTQRTGTHEAGTKTDDHSPHCPPHNRGQKRHTSLQTAPKYNHT